MIMRITLLSSLVWVCWWGDTYAVAQDQISGSAKALSGNMLVVGGRPVRLFGVNALALNQHCSNALIDAYPCGKVAAGKLGMVMRNQTVRCAPVSDRGDTAGPPLSAVCHVESIDLGAWIIGNGLAYADRSQSDAYVAVEARARAAGIGMWAGRLLDSPE